MNDKFVDIKEFAEFLFGLLKTDRDAIVGVGGFTGEGKSTFTGKLAKAYSEVSKCYWGFDRMTWSRKEMMKWIDGEPKSEKKADGLKPGQISEYSAVVPDELFYMFYKRNWYEEGQIRSISTFNTCRDRHLLVIGNVPDFWDLDPGFIGRVRFYVYIPTRGKAWIFQQESNPFSKDPWNVNENKKQFRKKGNPFSISNFVCQIEFDDWDEEEREQYYKIRNEKRVNAIEETKHKRERYKDIKEQRDNFLLAWDDDIKKIVKQYKFIEQNKDHIKGEDVLKLLKPWRKKHSNLYMSEVGNVSEELIRLVRGN